MKVWVLTREENAYDQFGEYFVEVFGSVPTVEQLRTAINGRDDFQSFISDDNLAYYTHIQSGGGRRDREDTWYNLVETDLK